MTGECQIEIERITSSDWKYSMEVRLSVEMKMHMTQ